MVSEKENLMGHCQKEVEMVFKATEFVAEPLPPNQSRSCVVDTCKQNHPPWVCKAFKELPVQKRKELITRMRSNPLQKLE